MSQNFRVETAESDPIAMELLKLGAVVCAARKPSALPPRTDPPLLDDDVEALSASIGYSDAIHVGMREHSHHIGPGAATAEQAVAAYRIMAAHFPRILLVMKMAALKGATHVDVVVRHDMPMRSIEATCHDSARMIPAILSIMRGQKRMTA